MTWQGQTRTKNGAALIVSKCMHGTDKLTAHKHSNLVEGQELYSLAFRLRLSAFAPTMIHNKWLSKGLHLDRMRVSEDKVVGRLRTVSGTEHGV